MMRKQLTLKSSSNSFRILYLLSLGRSHQESAPVCLGRRQINCSPLATRGGIELKVGELEDEHLTALVAFTPLFRYLKMRGSSALCWSVLLLVALFTHSVNPKGGRGGARGGARGGSRGTSRVRAKTPMRYGSFRVAAGAAAAGAVAGAAAGMAGRRRWKYDDDSNTGMQWNNDTDDGIYSYRAWTSGANNLSKCLPITLTSFATTILKLYSF